MRCSLSSELHQFVEILTCACVLSRSLFVVIGFYWLCSLLALVVFERLIVLPGTFCVLARDFVRYLFTGPAAMGGAYSSRKYHYHDISQPLFFAAYFSRSVRPAYFSRPRFLAYPSRKYYHNKVNRSGDGGTKSKPQHLKEPPEAESGPLGRHIHLEIVLSHY